MNIMVAVTHLSKSNGGVTTHVFDLCRELLKKKHRIILIADERHNDYPHKLDELLQYKNFRFFTVNILDIQSKPVELIKTAMQVTKIVKKYDIDIIHSHGQAFCIVCQITKILTGVPYLWTNHIDEIAQPQLFKRILKVLHFPIISVSTDLKNFLVNDLEVNPKRITVVNNGIFPDAFTELSTDQKKGLLEKYNPESKYLVTILARLSYGKGHKYLLEAIDILQTENHICDMKILIAGQLHENEKSYLESLINYANSRKIDLEYIGFQNPRDIFGIADVSVLPSIYEGFPLTVLESLAMRAPVIRSDTPGWVDTKDICLTFPKKNSRALAECLYDAYMHTDKMKAMALEGKNIVFTRFTIYEQVRQTEAVYRKILSKKKKG